MIQGSQEWFTARLGKVTASRICDVVAKGRSDAPSISQENYRAQIVAERLSGRVAESFSSAAMAWGTETEPQARACYTLQTGNAVVECGFVPHPGIEMAGASPDGLVGDDGLVEIKCPNTSTHIKTLLARKAPAEYLKQMQWQMACTGRAWCDFVSFDPRVGDDHALTVIRVLRDDDDIRDLEMKVANFLSMVAVDVEELRARVAP